MKPDEDDDEEPEESVISTNVYSVAVINLRDEGEKIMRELIFETRDEITGMNYSGRYLFFEFEISVELLVIDIINAEFIYNNFDPEGKIVVMKKSRELLVTVDESINEMRFYRVPDDSFIEPTHSFEVSAETLRGAFEGRYTVEIGEEYDDKDRIKGRNDEQMTGEKTGVTCSEKRSERDTQEKAGLDILAEMIGLVEVKEKVHEIMAYTLMQKRLADSGKDIKNPGYNMVFRGNPGTAKTSVARIIAKILKENGILPDGELYEVGRSDLVAGYLGQTAIKVKKAFKKAKGGVLFIDEAYSLVDDRHGYGDEAIATIVQEMENMKGQIAVILAGYPDKMDEFLKSNPGLTSRIQFNVDFPDYSAGELVKITLMEAKKHCFEISGSGIKKVREICREAMKEKRFGNGRFCRNLVQDAMMRYSVRNYGKDYDCVLEGMDFAMPKGLKIMTAEKGRIGFAV